MQILELISQFFNFIVSFLPRYTIIKTTHAAIKFTHGNRIKELYHDNGLNIFRLTGPTGIHLYWPLVSEVIQYPIKRQTTKLEKQILTTKDNKTVLVTAVVVYEVEDIRKLLTENWDHEDTIKDSGTLIIKECVTKNNFNEIADTDFTKPMKISLKPFGIKVIRVNLCDFATGRPILHMGIVNETNIINGHNS